MYTNFIFYAICLKDFGTEEARKELNELVRENQAILRDDLKVSHERNEQAISIIATLLPLCAAKVTGAGMGGCVIAPVFDDMAEEVNDKLQKLNELCAEQGFNCYCTELSLGGLTLSKC